MDGWMGGWMDEWMDKWMDGWIGWYGDGTNIDIDSQIADARS